MVSGTMARLYELVPIRFDEGTLSVAIAEVGNSHALDDLAFILDCRVEAERATTDSLKRAIENYYPESQAQ